MIPLFELKKEQERLSDFNWRATERPADRYSISQEPSRNIRCKQQTFSNHRCSRIHSNISRKFMPFLPRCFCGVTIDAVKIKQKETENRMNPFMPLESFRDSTIMEDPPGGRSKRNTAGYPHQATYPHKSKETYNHS